MSDLDDLCRCGHLRRQHIYHEGACRPGFVCPHGCVAFVDVAPSLFDPPRDRPEHRPPLAGHDDPPNSHEAAALFEPRRDSAKGRVLAFLRSRPGVWVEGHDLCAPAVGGEEGKRRARELRQAGHPIEVRSQAKGAWLYRYAPDEASSRSGAG